MSKIRKIFTFFHSSFWIGWVQILQRLLLRFLKWWGALAPLQKATKFAMLLPWYKKAAANYVDVTRQIAYLRCKGEKVQVEDCDENGSRCNTNCAQDHQSNISYQEKKRSSWTSAQFLHLVVCKMKKKSCAVTTAKVTSIVVRLTSVTHSSRNNYCL